jgi:prepilin-type N-terminal cleavage/methylation domain-containing protein
MHTVISRRRAGMTLPEMMVAMVLFGIVATSIYRVMMTHQRAFAAQMEITDLRQNIRAAVGLIPAELRELDAGDGDIIGMASDSIKIRSFRQFGIVCTPPTLTNKGATAGLTMVVRYPLYSSIRDFAVNDSLLLWLEGRAKSRTDDQWVPGKITTVTANTTCPDTKTAVTYKADLTINAAGDSAGFIQAGAPIRGYEQVTFRLFQDTDNQYYLGMRTGSSATTYPIIGPLTGASGLTFSYLDTLGASTADRFKVGRITLVLREQSARPVKGRTGVPANVVDSVTLITTLRNNPRY